MPTWTTPKTVFGGNMGEAAYLNTYLKGNLEWLKSRPFNSAATGNITTSSLSFVEATNSNLSLTTYGGDLLYWVCGANWNAGIGSFTLYDLAVDGVRQGHPTLGTAIITTSLANYVDNLNLMMISTTIINAGTHNCSLYWATSVSGTANANLRVYVMEIR